MNYPAPYDFPVHYKGDALASFNLNFTYSDNTPVDFTGAVAVMQLRDIGYRLAYTFSSEAGGDALLTIGDGSIGFPDIDSWDIRASVYYYDLQVTDATGTVRTYMRGKWAVNQDITWTI